MGILSRLFGSGEDTRTASAEPTKLTRYYIVGGDDLTTDFRETAWCIIQHNENGWGFVHNRRIEMIPSDEPVYLYVYHQSSVIEQGGRAYVVMLCDLLQYDDEDEAADDGVFDSDDVMPFPDTLRGEEVDVLTTLSEEEFGMLRLPLNLDQQMEESR
jgi:hypothetical protein